MPKYSLTITRSITVDVNVEAATPEEAVDTVNRHSYPLPPIEQWSGVKDWRYEVRDESGEVVHEVD